ncbi:MAG: MFS transporter [Chitinophagaceae bacterium]|nr:MFS transporter [Chitinophagaceae bacterium]MCW5927207.1 MFS transporter [Chitinophagaceae bacterium]
MIPLQQRKNYPWVVVGLLWVVALLNYLDRQMLATMKTSMQVDVTELQSATKFGYLMAIFLWVYGLTNPISGFIADRINRKWLIIGSLFVWSAVTFAMGYATTFNQLYLLRAVMGISEALYMPAGLSLIADFHPNKTRSLAIGIHMTGLYFGQALGGFGATIAAQYSWHTTFHSFGFIGLTYSAVLFFLLKDKERASRSADVSQQAETKEYSLLGSLKQLFTNVYFWLILFCFAVPSLPGWATKNWLPTLFSEKLSLDIAIAGPLATLTIAASSFAGVIFGGILSDRWLQKNIRGRVFTSAIGLLLMIPALLLIGFGQSLVLIVLAGCCFGIGFGMFDANNMPILYQFISPRIRATAYGIMNMTGIFAGAMVTDLLGKSTDAGNLGRDFAMLAGIVLVAFVIQTLFLRPSKTLTIS